MEKKIHIFALAACGQGISGSDRIFIEFARRWSRKVLITIYVWKEGYEMCQRQGLNESSIQYQVSSMQPWKKLGFIINYVIRIVEGIRIALTLKIENSNDLIVYSASEFWMDSLPAFILKMRFPEIKWAAAWFQTAPNPLIGFTESKSNTRYRLKSLIYFLTQFPVKPLIAKFANFVLVNNEEEKKQFPVLNKQERALVVLGAVDIKEIGRWRLKFKNLPKIYDGVFQGRFHPQKGVLELIDIWKLVVSQKKDAKLVMIGDGPLMEDVKIKIKDDKLKNNIILTGYLFDGEEKYRIFSQSKVVVHSAFYDSGGMASAEAMAFGLPCVGFNLKSFNSYYPKGMIKIQIGDLEDFAGKILALLSNEIKRKKIGNTALDMINARWSWDTRAQEILGRLIPII
ncbi:MAG: glycosyltransferase [Actinobacteria bacterium]|nr:glycosyltransferase [Actinomycetota bacterium]